MKLLLLLGLFLFTVYGTSLRRGRREHKMDNWMTEEQKADLAELKKSGSLDEMKKKIMEMYSALPEEKRKELDAHYKQECANWVKKVATQEEMAELKSLHEAGNNKEVLAKLTDYKTRLDAEERKMVDVWAGECKELWFGKTTTMKRKRKDINTLIDKHLSWLTDAQKQEIRDLKAAGKSNTEIKEKVLTFFQNLDGEARKKTQKKLTDDCYAWLSKVASKAEIDALHKLHETDHAQCKTNVREYIKRLPESEQDGVLKNLPFCEKIWYGDHDHSGHSAHGSHHGHHKFRRTLHHSRRARRHEDHNLENSLKETFDWLSDEQKNVIRGLENDKAALYKKLGEFFKEAPVDVKPIAVEKMKNACRHLMADAIGEEKVAELKKLRETGAANEQIGAKAEEYLDGAAESPAKARMLEAKEGCTKVYYWKAE
ncbi:unnamed protein product, partial [Mesorhabditis belari]|uniref:Polyprotein allergen nematode domain-containing protein n=1 Tax=Mesorhabditis belari TaxID=2138241 RepID=A0AAF3J421_9BILA